MDKLKVVNVVGAAIVDEDKILCAQRGYGDLKGQWEFPGGKIEPGETGEQAIIREIKEELDVDICVLRYITTSSYDYPTFHINLAIYEAVITKGEIHDHEHTSLKWVKRSDMEKLNWCPADVNIIKDVIK